MNTGASRIVTTFMVGLALLPGIIGAGMLDGELPVEKVDEAIVGTWEHTSGAQDGDEDKPSLRSFFEVRPNQSFSLRRLVVPDHSVTYLGVITKRDDKIVADAVLGPVVCPGGDRSWSVSLEGDVLTLHFATNRVEQYRRIAEPNKDAEQGVAPQSATRSESESEGSDKPQPKSEPRHR